MDLQNNSTKKAGRINQKSGKTFPTYLGILSIALICAYALVGGSIANSMCNNSYGEHCGISRMVQLGICTFIVTTVISIIGLAIRKSDRNPARAAILNIIGLLPGVAVVVIVLYLLVKWAM